MGMRCCPLSHSYIARTTPKDVARVEKQTFVCTGKKEDAIPTPREGVESKLGNWKSPVKMDEELATKFPGCMQGMVYIISTCNSYLTATV